MITVSDQRQNYRFPAYDDEVGVKLNKKRRKDFLKDILDDGFIYKEHKKKSAYQKNTDVKTMSIDPVEMAEEPDYFGYDQTPSLEDPYQSPKNKTTNYQPKKVTVEHVKRTVDKTSTYVEPINEQYISPQSSFANKMVETDSSGHAKYQKNEKNKTTFESSYSLPGAKSNTIFKPKHIPASLIDESDVDQELKSNRDVIIDELRKVANDNMFMIEDEAVLDPIVDPVDMVLEKNEEPVLDKKKHTRLEKTLSGIMADERSPQLDSYYFD